MGMSFGSKPIRIRSRGKQHGAGITPAPYNRHGTLRTGRRRGNLPKPSRSVAKNQHTMLVSERNSNPKKFSFRESTTDRVCFRPRIF
jgi:hypothetical protein